MSYYPSTDSPTENWVARQLEEISNRTEADFIVDESINTADAKYTLKPPSQNGKFVLYMGENPSIRLNHKNETSVTDLQLENISHIDFDIRPEDGQFRVGISGDEMFDYGFN